MTKILVFQGANMNWLGRRQPEVYGTTTADQLDERIRAYAGEKGFEVDIFYTNLEGEGIERLQQAEREGVDAIVMNPAGFSYAGYALRDAIKSINVPVVEVHISHMVLRGIEAVTTEAAVGVVWGFGLHSYMLGIDAALHLVAESGPSGGKK